MAVNVLTALFRASVAVSLRLPLASGAPFTVYAVAFTVPGDVLPIAGAVASAEATNCVVANLVESSFAACVVAVVPFGSAPIVRLETDKLTFDEIG